MAPLYERRCTRSRAEFCAKVGTVLEEADESQFWLDILAATGLVDKKVCAPLEQAADEINRLAFSARRTALQKEE
jgi:four helix bundle protein